MSSEVEPQADEHTGLLLGADRAQVRVLGF